ncbi:hypothetical protein Tco_1406035 [Tanacetum coccineum]
MVQSKHTKSDSREITKEKQPEQTIEKDDDIYKDLATLEALSVVTLNNFCNPSTEIDKSKDLNTTLNTMKTQNRKKSIAKKLKTNEDVEKQKEIPSPSKETTHESTPTKMTKATAARGLRLQNTPPSENPPTTPQTETTNVQNTRILSLVIQNDSTQTPAAKAVEIKEKSGKNYEKTVVGGKKKAIGKGAKKRKITDIESSGQRTRQSAKKQQVEKKEKEQVNKRKRDEKVKEEEEVKKKMVKIKGKKKVEDVDGDFVVEEPHDKEDDNKKCEPEFKSLRARTTVLPLYDATQSLSPKRKSKITFFGIILKNIARIGGLMSRTLQNWYYSPNTVLMLIYLHYTKCDGMVMIPRKWLAIRNWTSQDAIDREIFEMCQGKFGLVDVIEENEETGNESEAGTSGARHGNDNDDDEDCACLRNDEDEVGHANHGYVHANDDGNSGHVDADTNMFAASDTEKKSADKEDKEKAQMEKNVEQKSS